MCRRVPSWLWSQSVGGVVKIGPVSAKNRPSGEDEGAVSSVLAGQAGEPRPVEADAVEVSLPRVLLRCGEVDEAAALVDAKGRRLTGK